MIFYLREPSVFASHGALVTDGAARRAGPGFPAALLVGTDGIPRAVRGIRERLHVRHELVKREGVVAAARLILHYFYFFV